MQINKVDYEREISMENLERNIRESNTENVHKSLCTECPVYNGCMRVWLDYFAGKGYSE